MSFYPSIADIATLHMSHPLLLPPCKKAKTAGAVNTGDGPPERNKPVSAEERIFSVRGTPLDERAVMQSKM